MQIETEIKKFKDSITGCLLSFFIALIISFLFFNFTKEHYRVISVMRYSLLANALSLISTIVNINKYKSSCIFSINSLLTKLKNYLVLPVVIAIMGYFAGLFSTGKNGCVVITAIHIVFMISMCYAKYIINKVEKL